MEAKRRLVERDADADRPPVQLAMRADLAKMAGELSRLPDGKLEPPRSTNCAPAIPGSCGCPGWTRDGIAGVVGGLFRRESGAKTGAPAAGSAAGGQEPAGVRFGPIAADGERFAVLGIPRRDGAGIVGVVRQSVAEKVQTIQTEKLRLVPYPREGRYKSNRWMPDQPRHHRRSRGRKRNGQPLPQTGSRGQLRPAARCGRELERIKRDWSIARDAQNRIRLLFQSERSPRKK